MNIHKLVAQKYNLNEKELFFYEYESPNPYGDFNTDAENWNDIAFKGTYLIVYPSFFQGIEDYVSETPLINPTMVDIYYHLHLALLAHKDNHHVFLESIEEKNYKGFKSLSLFCGS